MKKNLILVLFLSLALGLNAQTAKEEIYADVHRSASNYYAYPEPGSVRFTPAPIGYKPFYISTYHRHGSRFLIESDDYTGPEGILQQADSLGKLTPLGKKVMSDLQILSQMSAGRLGELTPIGAAQHTGVAKRMYANFPDVFKGSAKVDARSTIVIRCILSMMNECMQLRAMNPAIEVKSDASEHDMYYMNYSDKELVKLRKQPQAEAALKKFRNEHTHPDRLMGALFTDGDYVRQNIKADKLMESLFKVASNMQSHKGQTSIDLYPLFTKEECYDLWQVQNLGWYVNYGPSPLTEGKMPYLEANLLKNFLDTADTCVVNKGNGATMRFGHEVCVLPLAALMELGNSARIVNNPDSLADEWRNYNIFMMASNIQWVFYRKPGDKDILVKALLNEHEVSLPVKSTLAPYYHWKDLEAYYRSKLAKFRGN